MVRFAVHTAGPDPERLYETGLSLARGTDRLPAVLEAGDRPIDLLVDLSERSVLWTFVGEHRGASPRAGYFVAEYRASGSDLFRGFEEALRSFRADEEWVLPRSEDPRWDAGFRLHRVAPDLPGLTERERGRLFEHLRSGGEPLVFSMGGYRAALRVVRAVDEAGLGVTVAVDGEDRDGIPEGVDLLLRPTGDADFEPASDSAADLLGSRPDAETVGIADGGIPAVERWRRRAPARSLGTLAGGTVCLLLALAAYSFVSTEPVHPITGLATLGGFVGALATFPGAAALVLEDDGTDADVLGASRRALRARRPLAALAVAYGTLLGFAYPTLLRVAGEAVGSAWLFGYVSGPGGGAASVLALSTASFLATWLLADWATPGPLGRERTVHLLVAHAVYAVPLFLATGLAGGVWYHFLPAV